VDAHGAARETPRDRAQVKTLAAEHARALARDHARDHAPPLARDHARALARDHARACPTSLRPASDRPRLPAPPAGDAHSRGGDRSGVWWNHALWAAPRRAAAYWQLSGVNIRTVIRRSRRPMNAAKIS
jgi:hypothetical protein